MSNRIDELLSKLLNGETADITPQSRIEAYLKALVDGSGTDGLPAPQSSFETNLHALVENGSGTAKMKFSSYAYFFYKGARLAYLYDIDTSDATNFRAMFSGCSSLTSIPELDTSKGSNFMSMFSNCRSLTSISELDTSKGTSFYQTFYNCTALTSIPKLDVRKSTNFTSTFESCKALTDLYIYNVQSNLTIGSGSSYGHLLTLDSLINAIRELRDTGSSKTLTMGKANLEKLVDVYVKTVIITDKMRAEDEFVDEKLPFEVCESADDGATLITDYVLYKNWQLK